MKTKTLIIFCLLLGFGLIQLSGQSIEKAGESQSYSYHVWGHFFAPAFCNGTQVDFLDGYIDMHMIDHYQNGNLQWQIGHHKGVVNSTWTGEEFQVFVLNKWGIPTPEVFTWRGNLIGNNGSHYVAEFTIEYVDGTFIYKTFKLIRAVCPGND